MIIKEWLKELAVRQEFAYPPFNAIDIHYIETQGSKTTDARCGDLAKSLHKDQGTLLGPEFAPIARLKNLTKCKSL